MAGWQHVGVGEVQVLTMPIYTYISIGGVGGMMGGCCGQYAQWWLGGWVWALECSW